MTNQELKRKVWDDMKHQYEDVLSYTMLELKGQDDDTTYFHPAFIFPDKNYISGQGDINNDHLYAFRINIDGLGTPVEEELLLNVVVLYDKNPDLAKEIVRRYGEAHRLLREIEGLLNLYFSEAFKYNVLTDTINNLTNKLKSTYHRVNAVKNMITGETNDR
jgi:hypothetical protein